MGETDTGVPMSVMVIRTKNMEEVREFLTLMGLVFETEKHGTGPLHYAAQVGEAVLEIYPHRSERGFPVEKIEFL